MNTSLSTFGLLSYENTGNLGDEIQSLASRQFLPRVDYYVQREQLNRFHTPGQSPTRLIMNGWYCHKPENWPPSPDLLPLKIFFP
jgi:hypothetical protein